MKVIIDTDVLQDVTDWNAFWGQTFSEFLSEFSKPLTLCQDCWKWKTIGCTKARCFLVTEGWAYLDTDPDDFCKDGEPKEIV